ncbi:hypothetical protein ACIRU2_23465 [Streptomyces sp. NPDC101169]|uniref:hypothetical protein n=1 Tax=Streptomyces sp. NPDC101169 TaxID=3366121 RepID=UPI003810BA4D
MALIAATMLPLLAAPIADAATTAGVTFDFSNGARVDAGSSVTINYSITNLPKGSHVELRRETGSSHTYKVIKTLKAVSGKGSVTTTAPTQGRWGYRIFILNSKNETLTYRGHWLYAYKNISISKFFSYKPDNGSIGIGSHLLSYNVVADGAAWDVFTTTHKSTCRAISLKLGRLPESSIMKADGKRTVKVVQTNAAAASVQVPVDTYTTLTAKLTGAPFGVHLNEDPSFWPALTYVGGTVNCYTPSGF